MPQCSAKGCKNISTHGLKLSMFPKDPERRKQWKDNCIKYGGQLWIGDHSVLCEFHFTPDCWEKQRVDGKKKLKLSAIPTIFGDAVPQVSAQVRKNQTIKNVQKTIETSSVAVGKDDPLISKRKNAVKDTSEASAEKNGAEKNDLNSNIPVSSKTSRVEHVEPEADPLVIIPTNNVNEEHSYQLSVPKVKEIVSFKDHSYLKDTGKRQPQKKKVEKSKVDDAKDDEEMEKELSELEAEIKSVYSKSRLTFNHKRLEELYSKSERLRNLIRRGQEKTYVKFKRTAERLANKVRVLKDEEKKINYYF